MQAMQYGKSNKVSVFANRCFMPIQRSILCLQNSVLCVCDHLQYRLQDDCTILVDLITTSVWGIGVQPVSVLVPWYWV